MDSEFSCAQSGHTAQLRVTSRANAQNKRYQLGPVAPHQRSKRTPRRLREIFSNAAVYFASLSETKGSFR